MDFDAILKKANRGFGKEQSRAVMWADAIAAMEEVARRSGPSADDVKFVRIVAAATHLGDGRARHIKAYKRLVSILEKLAPGISRFPR